MKNAPLNWKLIDTLKEGIDQLTEDEKIVVKDYLEGHPAPVYTVGGLMIRRMIEKAEIERN